MVSSIKYNYEKDFTVEVELPECVGENDFRIDFFTKGDKVYSASRIKNEYSTNIRKTAESTRFDVALRKHGLPPGLVRVRAYYWVKNEVSPDGIMQEVLSARETGIELWEGDTHQSKKISININGGSGSQQGTSITEIVTTYQASISGTIAPTGEWLSAPPNNAQGMYVWSRMEIKMSNGASRYHYSVSYQAKDSNGENSTPIFGEVKDYPAFNLTQPTIVWSRGVVTTVDKIVYLKRSKLFGAKSESDENMYFVRFSMSGGITQEDYQSIDVDDKSVAIHQNKTFVRVNTDELYVFNEAMGLKQVNEKLKVQ